MGDEHRELTELERDVEAYVQQYLDDIGLDTDTVVVWENGEEWIVTHSVRPIQQTETEHHRPPVYHSSLEAWREWLESEYAPSFYAA